ncbi:MAG TPA: reductive dehalogenase domain-containing protein [Bryobacteraceae bacterium]|nr:reductive dehalogenase domain-containing protein [Bryobacteraceae bacterium]
MAIQIENREPSLDGEHANGDAATARPPLPPLGKSIRIVGEVESVDYRQTPHPKNSRGELGVPMYNWYTNSISHDPLGRMASDRHAADNRNVVNAVVAKAAKGGVNPRKTSVDDPKVMSDHIKRVAKFIGFDVVGIANVHPSFVYKGGRYQPDGSMTEGSDKDPTDPEVVAKQFPYAVVACVAWDYDMGRAHRHRIGDAAYHFSQQEAHILYQTLAGYIRELGYHVAMGAGIPMPLAVAAGIGEMGRNGMVITEKFGSRIHMPDVILTDMPLVADKPIDLGVPDFCSFCRKCAITCPTNSIPFEDKVTHNGVEKFKINWLTCYRLRPHSDEHWEVCLTCAAVCPYSKPVGWWHALAIRSLRTTPKPLRQGVVRPLKWLDDKFWGRIPNRRVKWLGYDSGVAPGEKACMISGCNAHQDEESQRAALGTGNLGFYFPLRENTRRFESAKARKQSSN